MVVPLELYQGQNPNQLVDDFSSKHKLSELKQAKLRSIVSSFMIELAVDQYKPEKDLPFLQPKPEGHVKVIRRTRKERENN